MRKELVVACYKEPLSRWFDKIPDDVHVSVYRKHSSGLKVEIRDRINEFKTLPNVGRESHTYLTHIVNKYPNFADVTLFVQGDPRPHGYSLNFDKYFDLPIGTRASCMKLSSVKQTNRYTNFNSGIKHIRNWGSCKPARLNLANWWLRYVSSTLPDSTLYRASWGACFSVTSDYIISKPKFHYEALLNTVSDSIDPEEGHFMERAWSHIFHDDRNR